MAIGMEYISDILLGIGALAAAVYCVILSKKLNRLSGLDQELGTAIAVLSKQVDDLSNVLKDAQVSAETTRDELTEITLRAENVVARIEGAMEHIEEESFDVVAEMPVPADHEETTGLESGAPSLFLRSSRAVR